MVTGNETLESVTRAVVQCDRCPRLRRYCRQIAIDRRAAFRDHEYWARPVPGFGDPNARIVIIGLAPAAHGANRTGRMFTGDGDHGSGDFLMTALHANGLANVPFSRSADDGLALTDAWLTAAVRCAPPDNKPTSEEIAACHAHLRAETQLLRQARVYVALGRIAFDACLRLFADGGTAVAPKPAFKHGAVATTADGRILIASYHPSRQNTQTGRLTPSMLREVFRVARKA
jgi:uracil-DNA glycosylase family 4